MKLAIYDLDGTVICSKHRYRTAECGTKIDLQHWRENSTPEMIARDGLLPHANQFKKDLQSVDTIVAIATARVMGKADFDYIKKHLGTPQYIIHRLGDNDSRKGVDLKVSGVLKKIDLKKVKNITIYEDNWNYLQGMTEKFEAMEIPVYPVFVPSEQGH